MKRHYLGLFCLALFIGIIGFNLYSDKERGKSESAGIATSSETYVMKEGEMAPDFTVQTVNGKEIRLSDYRGKKVFLNFWTTWCPPCTEEIPHMQSFYNEKPANVEILAVNIEESSKRVSNFAKEYKLTFPILMDKDGAVSKLYEVYTIPTTYVLNEDGTIHQRVIGPMDGDMMKDMIKE